MCRQQLESVTVSELFSEWAKLDAQFVDSALGRMASNMGKGPNTPPFLVARLSTALTNRRRFFALWRKEDCMELAQNEHEMSKTQISRSLERLDNQKDCLLLSRKEYFTEGPLPEVESPTGQFLDDSAHKRGYVLLPNRRLLGEARLKTEVSLITAPEGVLLSETPEPLGKEPNTHKPSTGDHHSSDGPRSADPEHKLRDCFSYDGIGPDSPTSSLTSTRRWGDWPVEFPPPPPEVESDMDSTCHYCWTSCPSYEGRGSAWRITYWQTSSRMYAHTRIAPTRTRFIQVARRGWSMRASATGVFGDALLQSIRTRTTSHWRCSRLILWKSTRS
ncbi:hypothetical protein BJX68DRAFT_236278 [Aspergillus pseudodeflectus]|uniref:Uncharacterized protein n=1 Tax=Aspergillus pseudodeflectus TaxID=176178 RepID=A0ABR4KGN7_9EURO